MLALLLNRSIYAVGAHGDAGSAALPRTVSKMRPNHLRPCFSVGHQPFSPVASAAMFETTRVQLESVANTVTHLRRFL